MHNAVDWIGLEWIKLDWIYDISKRYTIAETTRGCSISFVVDAEVCTTINTWRGVVTVTVGVGVGVGVRVS